MDEAGDKGGWSEVDWLSNLPESLIIQVLLKLGTKDVVRCSALSSRWRNLWKYIPKLELEDFDFFTPNEMDPDCPSHFDRCVSFVDRFLGFNSDSCLESFKFVFSGYIGRDPDYALTRRWMETLIKRKVKHLEYLQDSCESDEFQIPPTIHTCESLVYLKLCGVTMSTPEFVALPFLKGMDLVKIKFLDDFDIERLISGCSVLENLFIVRSFSHDIRVCSQSLLTFTLDEDTDREFVENHLVVIDAPRLEYLELNDHFTPSFIIKYPSSLAKVKINIVFSLIGQSRFDPGDLPKTNMTISSSTLEVFYEYSRCEPLPLFRYLSSLRVKFTTTVGKCCQYFLKAAQI